MQRHIKYWKFVSVILLKSLYSILHSVEPWNGLIGIAPHSDQRPNYFLKAKHQTELLNQKPKRLDLQ